MFPHTRTMMRKTATLAVTYVLIKTIITVTILNAARLFAQLHNLYQSIW